MANRQSRLVPTGDVQGQGLASASEPNVPGDSGAAAYLQAEKSFDHLSTFLGKWADTAVKREAGDAGTADALAQGDNLKLRRDGTLAGEAYDAAAMTVYGNQLQASLRNDMFDAAEKNKGDPAAMGAAFDQINDQYKSKALIADPHLHAAFDNIFATTRFSYEKQAVRERDTALRKDAGESALLGIQTAERDLQRSAFTFGGDPDGDKNLADQAARVKNQYQAAADAGFITPANAIAKSRALDANVAVAKITGQFGQLDSPDAKAKFLENLDASYKDPKGPLKDIDVDSFTALRNSLQKGLNQDYAAVSQGAREIKVGVQSVRERLLSGYGVTPDEWGDLDRVAARSNSPELQQQVKAAQAEAATIEHWWTMKPTDLDAYIRSEKNRMGADATPQDLTRVKNAQTVLNRMNKEMSTDLIGFSERTGRIQPTALSPEILDNPAEVGPAFIKRKAAADEAAASGGVPAQYFTGPERDAWAKVLNSGGDKALAAATAIEKNWGPAVAAQAIREVAPKAGLMAQAADIVASGGSTDYARDVATSLAARGLDKYKPVDVKPADLKSLTADTYGNAFGHLSASVQDSAVAGARAAFDTRARIQGIPTDLSSGKGREAMQRSLQEAAGARFIDGVQYGGVGDFSRGWFAGSYKVPVPNDIRADKFRDVVGAITDDDLKALPNPPQTADGKLYSARDLRAGKLVAVNGGYRVALGDDLNNDPKYLRGADGNPFVLDIGGMSDTLRQRVPQAFRGQ